VRAHTHTHTHTHTHRHRHTHTQAQAHTRTHARRQVSLSALISDALAWPIKCSGSRVFNQVAMSSGAGVCGADQKGTARGRL